MQRRRRFKQTLSLKDRLAAFADGARARAAALPAGAEREELLKKVRQAEMAAQLDDLSVGQQEGTPT
jgi:hypothetical protein